MKELDLSDWALPPRTNLPYDSPSAEELILAVQEYLTEEVILESSGAQKWKLRIAVNTLSIALRELSERDHDEETYERIMKELNVTDDKDLSLKIKSGQFDDKISNLHKKLAEIVERKLKVSNPRHFLSDSDET